MFDVGFGELLLVGVVALLVLGPERLPGAARTAGKMLAKLRQGWTDVRDEVEREMEVEDLKKRVNDAVMQGRNAADEMDREARRHVDDIVEGVRPETAPKHDDAGDPPGPSQDSPHHDS